MKKSLIYILALSTIVGCQKSEVSERIPAEGESSAVIVGSLPETKTSFVDEGNVLKTEWVKDDALGFYWYKGGSIEGVGTGEVDKALNDKLIAESSGSSTTFKTHYYYMYQAGKDYLTYLYYPYNVNAGKNPLSVPFAVPSSQNQAGSDDIAHLAATDFLYATTMANRPNGEAEQTVMVTFNHALSVLNIALTSAQSNYSVSDIRVRFEDENEIFSVTEGSVNLSDGSLTLTSGTPEISLHFNEAAKLSATPVNAYMTITPGHAGKTFSVYATVNGIETKLGSKKVPASGLPAGVKAALSFEVGEMSAEHEYVDLSASGTANCYLVTSPGFYKFKADVKGNGVVPSQLESVAGETAIAPKSALVLWYNTLQKSNNWVDESPVYLSSVFIDSDGYIRFYTPAAFVPGNVVIAAFAEEGVTYENITVDENKCINNATLLWSWNIWAAEGYDPEATAVNADGNVFMDRNLGAVISGLGATGSYEPAGAVGNYYQWGRKDPFPAISDYGHYWPCQYSNTLFGTPTYTPVKAQQINGQSSKMNLNGQMFGYRTNSGGGFDIDKAWNLIARNDISSDKTTKNGVYVSYAVGHPYKYIINKSDSFGGWRTWINGDDASYKSFWGDADHQKTLFDPCPAGWRVSSKDEAEKFLVVAVNATMADNKVGYEYQGYYFPLTSTRSSDNARVGYVTSVNDNVKSVFWTSTPGNDTYKYMFSAELKTPKNYSEEFQKGNKAPVGYSLNQDSNIADACPVRCVKE
ncbi:MAG: fimbrillin family protein [Candidatus Cryptobacteroides sp.]|nr:fimbrillin family protein [Candidatus Cryptobacteroides sp.]